MNEQPRLARYLKKNYLKAFGTYAVIALGVSGLVAYGVKIAQHNAKPINNTESVSWAIKI